MEHLTLSGHCPACRIHRPVSNSWEKRGRANFCPTAALFRPWSTSMMMDFQPEGGDAMSSTLSQRRFGVPTALAEPSVDETSQRDDLKTDQVPSKRPSLRKRASRSFALPLITFCIGVAATLAWQSYGDAAREMIANSSPQLSWLAPQNAPAQTPRNMVAPAAPSPDQQQLNATSLGLAAMRQSLDQLAAQIAAAQEQMRNESTKLQTAQQRILDKISVPPPPPHKPAPLYPAR